MSTIKVNNIVPPNVGEGVSIDGLQMPTAGALSNRNLIINGAMQVAQRATSATIQDGANEGYRTLDRWRVLFSNSAGGVATMSQDTTVPNKEFTSSLKIDVTTADTSFEDNNQAITIQYRFEGQDIANSGWDYSSSSSYLNVSFWAKSNKAGTYCVFLYTQDGTKHANIKEYTLAANTWQFVSFAYPGNSGLSFDNDNAGSLYVGWTLQAALNRYNGVTPDQWKDATTVGYYATSNQVNFFDSTNNNWYLTGVQIEVGSKATPFEHESYGQTLAKCQRYLFRINGSVSDQKAIAMAHNHTTTQCRAIIHLPTAMRDIGQAVSEAGVEALYGNTSNVEVSITSLDEGMNAVGIICTGSGFTTGRANFIRLRNAETNFFQIESEL